MKIISSSKLDPETLTRLKAHVYDNVGCCQEVHRELGPWLNEYMYQEALKVSFEEKQVSFEKGTLFSGFLPRTPFVTQTLYGLLL